jgi:GxxExxY protein
VGVSTENITTESTEGTENNVLEYYHLGEIQIDGAIDMYEKGNFICAASLAGAANTLLYSLIEDQNKRFSMDSSNALADLKRYLCKNGFKEENLPDLSRPRNALKHYAEGACEKEWNIKANAETEIVCASYNLLKLTQKTTKRISAFTANITKPNSFSVVNNNYKSPEQSLNQLSGEIIDAAIHVHKLLGPGLLESAYQAALAHTLTTKNIPFEKEKTIPVQMDDITITAGYRADFVVDGQIILEIKSVEKLAAIHDAQLLTYMKLGKFSLGILLNFNEKLLKDGIRRMKL